MDGSGWNIFFDHTQQIMVEFHQILCCFPVTVTRADTQMSPSLVKMSVLSLPHSLSASNTFHFSAVWNNVLLHLGTSQLLSPSVIPVETEDCENWERWAVFLKSPAVVSPGEIPCSGVSRENPQQWCLQGESPVLVVSRGKIPSI